MHSKIVSSETSMLFGSPIWSEFKFNIIKISILCYVYACTLKCIILNYTTSLRHTYLYDLFLVVNNFIINRVVYNIIYQETLNNVYTV